MNISVLPATPRHLTANSLLVNDNIVVEWKSGEARTVTVIEDLVDQNPVLTIFTGKAQGWIRLRINPNKTENSRVFAVRIALSLSREASIKPYVLEVDERTQKSDEAGCVKWGRLTLGANNWNEVVGSYLVRHLSKQHRLDMIVDLPNDSTVTIADCKIAYFGTVKLQSEATNNSRNSELEPIAGFRLKPIDSLRSWLNRPALFGSDFKISNGLLEGWAITETKELFISSDDTRVRNSLIMEDDLILTDGSVLPASKLSKKLPTTEDVEIYLEREGGSAVWKNAAHNALKVAAPAKAIFPRDRQKQTILIWCPITVAGLTVQLEQVAEIFTRAKLDFQISYHMAPRIEHQLCKHWVDPKDIDSPKMVLYMERFVAFDRGFSSALKVFYLNLDWLAEHTRSVASVHADVVICPTPHILENISEEFSNSRVVYLPWPAKFKVTRDRTKTIDGKARVLYVGNDYDNVSRKHPLEVVEAISRLKREDLIIDLKFRSPLPATIRKALEANPRVDRIIDWSTNHDEVEELYRSADLNLIPNACEGNGLSILEAWSKGAVPAVLDGHPMKDVVRDDNSFLIPCEVVGHQERAPLHHASTEQIHNFLENLDIIELQKRKNVVHGMDKELNARNKELENSLISFAMMSGIRTRGIRMRVENAHLATGRFKDAKPRLGDRVKDLLFKDEGQLKFGRPPRLVDVVMTTSQRPWCLRQSLNALLQAIRSSPYEHRLYLLVDTLDLGTMAVINQYSSEIDQVLWTKDRHGLPYMWNTARDLVRNAINRTERRPSYVCYIQDDCLIVDPDKYFAKMVGIATDAMPGYLGYVSGFYTEVHPGWADFDWKGEPVIASDSIDGKNFMGTPEVIESIGPLTWWFKDGMRRGNPGPVRGSHFDLWQWKESTNSLTEQKRISLILPRLCKHVAERAQDSTWNNDTTQEATRERIESARVYETRRQPEKS